MNDPFDDPVWHQFAKHAVADMLPKLTDSAVSVSIAPMDGGVGDVKYWCELGASIMLDKPIIVIASPGQQLPERLVRVADKVIYADLESAEGQKQVAETLAVVVGE
jgi:hypothetical protein